MILRATVGANSLVEVSDEQAEMIRDMLAQSGFAEPFGEWLSLRLSRIAWDLHRVAIRRDVEGTLQNLQYFEDHKVGIKLTTEALDRWLDDLTSPKVRDDDRWSVTDEWEISAPPPSLRGDEKLEDFLLPTDFSDDDIATVRRALEALADLTEGVLSHHRHNLDLRPERNERPEIAVVIGGLVRLWCQATKIREQDIKISSSSGSPAMNFIEAAAAIYFENVPQRETLERHVIAYRNARRLATS